jgi:RimJ/RimL family protein N-acetyltransferase
MILRAFEPSDLPLINKWHNSQELNMLTCGRKYFISEEYDKEWLNDKIFNNTFQVYLAICSDPSTMIGYISLNEINSVNRTAQWGGVFIGNDYFRNKGYATEAAINILKYGFLELNLQKISGHWLNAHLTSIMMGKLLGFKQEGVLRREVYKNGIYNDVIIMSMLKEEFLTKYQP